MITSSFNTHMRATSMGILFCIASTSSATYTETYTAYDIATNATKCIKRFLKEFKKFIKKTCVQYKTLKGCSWLPGVNWMTNAAAKAIATHRGCGPEEIKHAIIISRFVHAGELKKQAVMKLIQGNGSDVLERVFTELQKRFGTITSSVEIRTAMIDLLHEEMMNALHMKGSKDWFCNEIERKNKKKEYVIHDDAFNTYLHQIAISLFAIYWFENHI